MALSFSLCGAGPRAPAALSCSRPSQPPSRRASAEGTGRAIAVASASVVAGVAGRAGQRSGPHSHHRKVLASRLLPQRSAAKGIACAASASSVEEAVPSNGVARGSASGQQRARKTGVLLLNIGTPASTSVDDVRDYLSRFLSDDRVIEIEPGWLKAILLQLLLATRPASSAANYRKIWDPVRGSPLLFHSQDLAIALQEELGSEFLVRLGFAYSEPYVEDAFKSLAAEGVDDVALVPMFPHYASSTTGSLLENVYKSAASLFCTPFLKVVPPFYNHAAYLACVRQTLEKALTPDIEHLVFSFHGLPESQCARTDETESVCLRRPNCCAKLQRENRNCYRAQCYETARVLARDLNLADGSWTVAFQSRLTLRGRIQWIRPYTDEVIEDLGERGMKKVAVVAPSFTADCVETLEELGISGQEEFEAAGGKELVLVPCLNSSPEWVEGLATIVREQLAAATSASSPVPAAQAATVIAEPGVYMCVNSDHPRQ